MKNGLVLFWMILLSCHSHIRSNYSPDKGYIPDAETAKKIAEAIWLPIYGESVLDEKPYNATLVGDSVWTVSGTFHHNGNGGVAMIELRKKDCKVLQVIHGK